MIAPTDRSSKIGAVIRVSSGNFLEMYDFMVFGYYAAAIGRAFFPSGNPFVSLMLSLMMFGAGFLMRPLGAIVLGAYTDRHGRRAGLLLTLGLMSVGIFAIACMPGYATIGLLAPLFVLIGRLLQGFSAGMELGGVSVYLSEIATPGHKGFYVSWQSGSQQVAVMFAALVGVALNARLPPEKMTAWGWRVPLLLGFRWAEGSYVNGGPIDHFSVRWSGYFIPRTDDDYKFFVSADDGVRLYVNDERVIDDWQRRGETLDTYTAHLEQGKPYKIRLEYFENVGTATARFGIAPATRSLGASTKAAAAKADAVILCMGFDPSSEGEGFDRTFRLPGGQDAFIQQIAAINKSVIVVLTAGGNVDMTRWIDTVPGLIHAWYPGQEGGTALAQILFGEINPAGKLPASFERRWEDNAAFDSYYPKRADKHIEYKERVFLSYRHFDRSKVQPLFPFGYGLSNTTFQYSDLKATPLSADLSAPITVSCNVKNTGSREGAEVAEVYVGDSHASVPRPVKELKGFAKVHLRPGETKRVTVGLDRRAFSFYDVEKNNWKAEPGKFSILVGSSSEKIELQEEFTLSQ